MPPKKYNNQRELVTTQFYSAIHHWLKKKYGMATKCESLKCIGKSNNFQWAKRADKPYDFKRSYFKQLCRSCHAKQDVTDQTRLRMREVNPRTKQTHCRRGHELKPDNIRVYKGAQRNCIQCGLIRNRDNKRKRRAALKPSPHAGGY